MVPFFLQWSSDIHGKIRKGSFIMKDNFGIFWTEEMLDWNYKKGDWSVFKTVLDDGLRNWTSSRIWSDVTIEYNLESFLTELYKALEIACPKNVANINSNILHGGMTT